MRVQPLIKRPTKTLKKEGNLPNPGLSKEWIERIWVICGVPPPPHARTPSPAAIWKILDKEERQKYGDESYPYVPSEKSIQRQVAAFNKLSPDEKARYRVFHWPQTMIRELVPWEASAVAMEVLKLEWERNQCRPSVRRVLWYWRVLQAAPRLKVPDVETEGYVNGLLALETIGRTPPSFDMRIALGDSYIEGAGE